MKTIKSLTLTFSFLLLLCSMLVSAQNIQIARAISTTTSFSTFTSLDGKWTNTDPKALPKLVISANSTQIKPEANAPPRTVHGEP